MSETVNATELTVGLASDGCLTATSFPTAVVTTAQNTIDITAINNTTKGGD